MIVTIDGPAGAGKSTIARGLAGRLGFRFLDTGAMYRAVAWAAMQRRLDWNAPEQLVALAAQLDLRVTENSVEVDGQDVTQQIRLPEVTEVTHYPANNAGVRAILVQRQREAAGNDNIVTDGRDQGTVVFPKAQCKIYLTADPRERARRRAKDLEARGQHVSVDEVLQQQNRRDALDASRSVGPLAAAPDAVEVPTDGLTPEQVLDRLESLVREKMQP